MPRERTFSTGAIAGYCGVNMRTVIRWIERGELAAFRLPGGGNNRVTEAEFLSFLRRNEMPVPPELEQRGDRILIVDDDRGVSGAIQRVLRRGGYTTMVAEDGFRAGALLGAFRPDLVTLDLAMPALDGFDVIRFIRQHQCYHHTRILVISGQDEIQLRRARELGADEAISKPFANTSLVSLVQQMIGVAEKP